MSTTRQRYDHKWYWEGKQSRYYYKHSFMTKWTLEGVEQVGLLAPKFTERVVGTVTRVADTKSPHFNRWFAEMHKAYPIGTIKSEPMLDRKSAMAWLEVIERMNRG
jgi:hypothetical protein